MSAMSTQSTESLRAQIQALQAENSHYHEQLASAHTRIRSLQKQTPNGNLSANSSLRAKRRSSTPSMPSMRRDEEKAPTSTSPSESQSQSSRDAAEAGGGGGASVASSKGSANGNSSTSRRRRRSRSPNAASSAEAGARGLPPMPSTGRGHSTLPSKASSAHGGGTSAYNAKMKPPGLYGSMSVPVFSGLRSPESAALKKAWGPESKANAERRTSQTAIPKVIVQALSDKPASPQRARSQMRPSLGNFVGPRRSTNAVHSAQQHEALLSLTQTTSVTLHSTSEALDRIADDVFYFFGKSIDGVAVYYVDHKGTLECRSTRSHEGVESSAAAIVKSDKVAMHCVRTGETINLSDVSKDERFAADFAHLPKPSAIKKKGGHSLLAYPVTTAPFPHWKRADAISLASPSPDEDAAFPGALVYTPLTMTPAGTPFTSPCTSPSPPSAAVIGNGDLSPPPPSSSSISPPPSSSASSATLSPPQLSSSPPSTPDRASSSDDSSTAASTDSSSTTSSPPAAAGGGGARDADSSSAMMSGCTLPGGATVVAVIQIFVSKRHAFRKSDLQSMSLLSAAAMRILHDLEVLRQEIRERQRSHALLEAVKVVNSTMDVEVIIESIIRTAYQVLSCDRITLFMIDEMTNELWCKVSKDARGFRLQMGKGIAGYVAETGEILNIPDAYKDDRFNSNIDRITKYHTKTVLCVPIVNETTIAGVIQCINKKCERCDEYVCNIHDVVFDEQDIEIASSFASETAAALQRRHFESAFRLLMEETPDDDVREFVSTFMSSSRDSITDISNSISTPSSISVTSHGSNLRSFGTSPTSAASSPRIELEPGSSTPRSLVLSPSPRRGSRGKAPPPLTIPLTSPRGARFSGRHLRSLTSTRDWPTEVKLKVSPEFIRHWDFDYWEIWESENRHDDLLGICVHIFQEYNLISKLNIPIRKLRNFLLHVRERYWPNHYHNFLHGFSVLHLVFLVTREIHATRHLTTLDIFALLVAALCHDLEHPGKDNKYQINSSSDLALRYNDSSVLENHHAACCFAILKIPECDILSGMSREQRLECRASIIQAILHTDMTRHEYLMNNLKQRSGDSSKETKFSRKSKEDREFLIQVLTHAADLGNAVLRFDLYSKWAERVVLEFVEQAKMERDAGLPVLPFMEKHDPLSVANLQVNFIKFVVGPLWNTLSEVFDGLSTPVNHLGENRETFERYIEAMAAASQHATEIGDLVDGEAGDDSSTSGIVYPDPPLVVTLPESLTNRLKVAR